MLTAQREPARLEVSSMNSRQRILAAIDHDPPDRVPLDLGATPSSGISAMAYGRLCEHLDLPCGPTRVYDVVQQLAQPAEPLLERLGVDAVDVGRAFEGGEGDWHAVHLADGSPASYPRWFRPEAKPGGGFIARAPDGEPIAEMPAGGAFFDQTCYPWIDGYPADFSGLDEAMGKVLWAAFATPPWDRVGEDGFWEALRARTLDLREGTDRALVIGAGCNLFEWGTFLRRLDNFLMDLACDPGGVERLLDALMERHLAFLGKVCAAVGDLVDIVRFGDDLGMDGGPFMSPEAYRRHFKPRHRKLCEYVKSHSGMRTFLHSCGSIYQLIPDLIEAGFEVLNPVQTSSRDMQPDRLKREFGGDLTFWGAGCDTRRILNLAEPEEVRAHVLENLDILAPGGGFVFNTVHNILPEVPPRNIEAMYAALDEFNGG